MRGFVLMSVVLGGGALAETPDGSALFTQNCVMCHQNGAVGLAGQFPRLAGRVGPISAKPAGKAYLVDVLTYGMVGMVTIDGQPIIGQMPSFATLPDDQAAAILGYLQGLGGAPKGRITAAEVTEQRGKGGKSPAEVMAERQGLAASGVVK